MCFPFLGGSQSLAHLTPSLRRFLGATLATESRRLGEISPQRHKDTETNKCVFRFSVSQSLAHLSLSDLSLRYLLSATLATESQRPREISPQRHKDTEINK